MGYEVIDHTGDVGIRVREGTLEELFVTAARAMFALILEKAEPGTEPAETTAEGEDEADLLRNWLGDMLYNFLVEGSILSVDSVVITEGRKLTARGRTRRFDPHCDILQGELKAVTYHQLEVRRAEEGWTAQVIFDV